MNNLLSINYNYNNETNENYSIPLPLFICSRNYSPIESINQIAVRGPSNNQL